MTRTRLLLASSLLLVACAAPPAPLPTEPAPPCVVPLLAGGPTDPATPPAEGLAAVVHVEVLALREPPPGTAVELAASAIRSDRGQPFRGASELPIGTRWSTGATLRAHLDGLTSPDELTRLGADRLLVAPGLGASLQFASATLPRLRLEANGDALAATVIAPEPPASARQELPLQQSLRLGDTALLYVPADEPVARAAGLGFALVVQVLEPATEAEVEAARAAATQPAAKPPESPLWRRAIAAIGEHNRRPALLALAQLHRLPRCTDLVLAADERALVEITAGLAALPVDAREQAVRIEAAMLQALLTRLERDDLPPGLTAALRRQLGAATDDTFELRRMLVAGRSCDEFTAMLTEENREALTDRSASVRVRADDWLRLHGAGVPGFDPLGPARQRREALRRAAAEAAANASSAASPEPTGAAR